MKRSLLLRSSFVLAFASLGCGNKEEPKVATNPPSVDPTTSPSTTATAEPEGPKKPEYMEGPVGFPLPKDSIDKGAAPGGAGKIVVYEVPRGRDEVGAELTKLLEAAGWKTGNESKSPNGTIRFVATKGDTTVKVSIAGDATKAGIILTVP